MFPRRRPTLPLPILVLIAPLLLANKGCEEKQKPMDEVEAVPITPDTCSEEECGPKPLGPTVLCSDGTLGGYGSCKRMADDSCGYSYRACPTGTDGGVDADQEAPLDAAITTRPDADISAPDANVRRCGTRSSGKCAVGEFCNYLPESSCGSNDLGGFCEPLPEVCIDASDKPVCGCDDRSYPSACHANALGVAVLHDGLCTVEECRMAGGFAAYASGGVPASCPINTDSWNLSGGLEPILCCAPKPTLGRTCGGFASLRCNSGEWCNPESSAEALGCHTPDGTGTCQSLQQPCPMEYTPVCGCNLRTYQTHCAANMQQVAVLHDGPCTDEECKSVSGAQVVMSIGGAPTCPRGTESFGAVKFVSGQQPIEGALCCVRTP